MLTLPGCFTKRSGRSSPISADEVRLPNEIKQLMHTVSRIISLGIEIGLEATPLECIGLGGYLPELVFWVVAPAVIVLVGSLLVLIGVSAWQCYLKRYHGQESGISVLQAVAPVVCYLLFLLCTRTRV